MDPAKLESAQRLLNAGMPPKYVAASLGVSEATLCRALDSAILSDGDRGLDGMIDEMDKSTRRASEALDDALGAVKASNERIALMESGERPVATGEGDSDAAAWNALLAQGETVRNEWVRTGLLVPSAELETAWGCSRQVLDQAAKHGELFALKVGENRYYPAVFKRVEPDGVKAVCFLLKGDDVVAKFVFWNKTHGGLRGLTPADAIQAGQGEKVAQLADAWSAERGLTA